MRLLERSLSRETKCVGLRRAYRRLGGGNQKKYEELKRTNLSYTDECELVDILEEEMEENDLIARVRRLSDDKHLYIGLSWLTTKNRESKDYQLLDNFATWAVNW